MFIDKHYPFEMIPLSYSLSGFSDFLDFQTLSIHYNQIYQAYVEKLNQLLKDNPSLQNLSLDEILFNEALMPKKIKDDLIEVGGGVYNHQIIFNSVTPNPHVSISPLLKKAIEKEYQSLNNFYQAFKQACLNHHECGFVFLVCDQNGDVKIRKTNGNLTTVKDNLYPLLGIDLFEHAYFLKYKHQKKAYVDNFLKYICFEFANQEYEACLKAIKKQ